MKKIKKAVLVMGATILFAGSLSIGQKVSASQNTDNILSENIEALTETEYETLTTWNCTGTPLSSVCEEECGVCGTKIHGNGKLTGEHKCKVIKDDN